MLFFLVLNSDDYIRYSYISLRLCGSHLLSLSLFGSVCGCSLQLTVMCELDKYFAYQAPDTYHTYIFSTAARKTPGNNGKDNNVGLCKKKKKLQNVEEKS